MSATANWSYDAKATIWPQIDTDEFNKPTYGPPIVIDCDYGSRTRRKNAEAGREISVNLYVWTEYAGAKEGDKLAIGEFDSPTPVDDADVVIDIGRDADTFDRVADDYEIATG
ncbi:hypothetical protein ABQ345_14165 [Serratia fonticola]|uniref:hypothetical protein n=1 Tax=Serratia fonticola TaxID=47917 RepID=UPI003AAE1106